MLREGVLVGMVIGLCGLTVRLRVRRGWVGWVTKILLNTLQTHVDKLVLRADLLRGLE